MLRKEKRNIIISVFIVFIMWLLRHLTHYGLLNNRLVGDIRFITYIILLLAWGFSVKYRIIQRSVRCHLLALDVSMIVWMILKYIKYFVVVGDDLQRYLWYGYYIPMMMVALLSFCITICLGKSEEERLPGAVNIIMVVGFFLIGLVLTNDMHGLVFTFEKGKPMLDSYSHYNIGAYLIWAYVLLLSIVGAIHIYIKCRIELKHRKFLLPIMFMGILLAYLVAYALGLPFIMRAFGDMTNVICALTVGIYESFFLVNIIQNNSCYEVLLLNAGISTLITSDEDGIVTVSEDFKQIPKEILTQARQEAVIVENSRISGAQIKGGYVYWKDEIAELLELTRRLEENNEELSDFHNVLQTELDQKEKKLRIQEKNYIYDEVQRESREQVRLLASYIEQLKSEEEGQTRELLGKIIVTGAFIKRISNLVFVVHENGYISRAEVQSCVKEICSAIEEIGIDCGFSMDITERVSYKFIELFKKLQFIVELTWDRLERIYVRIEQNQEGLLLRTAVRQEAIAENGERLIESRLNEEGIRAFKDEDEIWTFTYEEGLKDEF